MTFGSLALKNVFRSKGRTLLTMLAVAVAVIAFILLRTVLSAWTAAADHAAKDRIASRHKVSFVMMLPGKYVAEIEQVPGVQRAAPFVWFGAKDPKHEDEFFATIAVDPTSFLEVYDEVEVPADRIEAWKQNRRGVLVGDVLAKKFGWKVGDRVTLTGQIYPGDWEFEISGIYGAKRRSIDRSTVWFHYAYLNESLPARTKDQVGWIVARIDDAGRSAEISKAIDAKFEERDLQTLTMSERALQTSFLGMVSAVLQALDVVSIVILLIMVLIVGNTIAMGVRERTNEYGMLRAIGFLPKHILGFVLGEAVAIGAAGGLVGIALSYPVVERGLGRFIEENMGAYLPYFRIAPATLAVAVALALGLGLVAAALPAVRASRLDVVDALRRIG